MFVLYVPFHIALDIAALTMLDVEGGWVYLVFVVNVVLAGLLAAALTRGLVRLRPTSS
jgi:hypothetical protein